MNPEGPVGVVGDGTHSQDSLKLRKKNHEIEPHLGARKAAREGAISKRREELKATLK